MPITLKSPYNFKKLLPMLMIALTPAAFMSCDKDNEPKITTKYTFGYSHDTRAMFYPTTEIEKDTKNSSVEEIVLKSDSKDIKGDHPIWAIRDDLEGLMAKSNGKIKRFEGELVNIVCCDKQGQQPDGTYFFNEADSLWAVHHGLKVKGSPVQYRQKTK